VWRRVPSSSLCFGGLSIGCGLRHQMRLLTPDPHLRPLRRKTAKGGGFLFPNFHGTRNLLASVLWSRLHPLACPQCGAYFQGRGGKETPNILYALCFGTSYTAPPRDKWGERVYRVPNVIGMDFLQHFRIKLLANPARSFLNSGIFLLPVPDARFGSLEMSLFKLFQCVENLRSVPTRVSSRSTTPPFLFLEDCRGFVVSVFLLGMRLFRTAPHGCFLREQNLNISVF
jgi:hypothetical protein